MLADLLGISHKVRIGPRTGPGGRVMKTPVERRRGRGTGNWACWEPHELGTLLDAAARWAKQLPPGNKYWLCWNINDAWCRLQQRLVLEAGWTPVVGADCTVSRPTILDGTIFIDFNAGLEMPSVWPHFPLEFVFNWVDRLAFWHADVLLPRAVLRAYAKQFEALTGPVTAAVYCRRSLLKPRRWDNAPRWWEVIGCTTRAASRRQFECGGGWWRHFQNHPYCGPVRDLVNYHWDSGGGIEYWRREHGGTVERLHLDPRYHFSATSRRDLARDVPKGDALGLLDLPAIATELGITDLGDLLDG